MTTQLRRSRQIVSTARCTAYSGDRATVVPVRGPPLTSTSAAATAWIARPRRCPSQPGATGRACSTCQGALPRSSARVPELAALTPPATLRAFGPDEGHTRSGYVQECVLGRAEPVGAFASIWVHVANNSDWASGTTQRRPCRRPPGDRSCRTAENGARSLRGRPARSSGNVILRGLLLRSDSDGCLLRECLGDVPGGLGECSSEDISTRPGRGSEPTRAKGPSMSAPALSSGPDPLALPVGKVLTDGTYLGAEGDRVRRARPEGSPQR